MRALLLILPLWLAACVPMPVPVPPHTPAEDACGAAGLQSLVGQPATVLETLRFSQTLRVVEPGMAVTMDYAADRLNIWLSRDRIIDRVTCG